MGLPKSARGQKMRSRTWPYQHSSAGDTPHLGYCVCAGNWHYLIDDGPVPQIDSGNEAIGDPLDLVMVHLAAEDGARLVGLDRYEANARLYRPESLPHPNQGAACAYPHDEGVRSLSPGELAQNLGPKPGAVLLDVVLRLELERGKVAGFAAKLLREAKGFVDVKIANLPDLGSKGVRYRQPGGAHSFWHQHQHPVSLDGRYHAECIASVSAARLDDGHAGFECAIRLGLLDHVLRDSGFDGTRRVQELELCVDPRFDLDQGRLPYGGENRLLRQTFQLFLHPPKYGPTEQASNNDLDHILSKPALWVQIIEGILAIGSSQCGFGGCLLQFALGLVRSVDRSLVPALPRRFEPGGYRQLAPKPLAALLPAVLNCPFPARYLISVSTSQRFPGQSAMFGAWVGANILLATVGHELGGLFVELPAVPEQPTLHDLSDDPQALEEVGRCARAAVECYPELAGAVDEPVLINVSENATFLLDLGDGERRILRIHRLGYHCQVEVESELAWSRALRQDTGISTPVALPNGDGQMVTRVCGSARLAVLFEYVAGEEVAPAGLKSGFETLGELSAQMHRHAAGWRRPGWFSRFSWDIEAAFGAFPRWGAWMNGIGVGPEEAQILARLEERIRERLAAFGADAGRYGLIHADMRLSNLIWRPNGDASVIDFDDSGFGWYLYDLAASLSFIEHTPEVPDLIDAWVNGYQRHTSLSAGEIAELWTFVMLRRLLLVAWIGSHQGVDLARELGASYTEQSCELAERFLSGRCAPS